MAFPQINCFCMQTITGYVVGGIGTLISILKSIECVFHMHQLSEIAETEGNYERIKLDIYCELVASILYFVSSILLIIGIKKKSHWMLLPWLVINVIVAIALTPMLLFVMLYGVSTKSDHIVAKLLIGLLIALLCLIWIAVLALFMNIRSAKVRNREMENQKRLSYYTPRYEVVQKMNV